jgi:hypothetical protein
LGLFFGLGGFSVVDCVGGEGLCHTAMFDSMYRCGSVGVGHVEEWVVCEACYLLEETKPYAKTTCSIQQPKQIKKIM